MSGSHLIVLGARGTHATPGARYVRYGGETTSFAVPLPSTHLVVDAGTGILELGRRLAADPSLPRRIDLLFTHFHLDHVMGLPPLAVLYEPGFAVHVHLLRGAEADAERAIGGLLRAPFWPIAMDRLPASLTFHGLGEVLEIDGVAITHAPLTHPGGSVAYRLEREGEAIVVATDHEPGEDTIDGGLVALSAGARAVLFDAHVAPADVEVLRGHGHGTWEEGVALAERAGVETLVLCHHNPAHDDETMASLEADARRVFPRTRAAVPWLELPFR